MRARGPRIRARRSRRTSNPISVESLVVNAVAGYLKAAELRPSNGLQHLCQMFSVLITMTSHILQVPIRLMAKVIPQITAQVNHIDERIRQIVTQPLFNIAKTNFQELYFPLILCDKDGCESPREVLPQIRTLNVNAAEDADMSFDGMVRHLWTWFESLKSLDSGDSKRLFTMNHRDRYLPIR